MTCSHTFSFQSAGPPEYTNNKRSFSEHFQFRTDETVACLSIFKKDDTQNFYHRNLKFAKIND